MKIDNFRDKEDFAVLFKLMESANSKALKEKHGRLEVYKATAQYKGNNISVLLFDKMDEHWKDIITELWLFGIERKGTLELRKLVPVSTLTNNDFYNYYGISTALVVIEYGDIISTNNICAITSYVYDITTNQTLQSIRFESSIL